jgi:acyl carrier protein
MGGLTIMNEETRFLAEMKKILETDNIAMDTELADLYDWDSLCIIKFSAMVNNNYDIVLDVDPIEAAITIRDLFLLTQNKCKITENEILA